MAAKKTSGLKTVFLSMIVIALIALIAAVLFVTLFAPKNDLTDLPEDHSGILQDQGNMEKPDQIKEDESVQIDLVDYTVYDLDELDFRFIIAKVRVKASDAANISLSHFTTSENISLSEVDSYVSSLEKQSYYLGKQNVVFELVSSETNYLARIFIPVNNASLTSLSVSNDLKGGHTFKFDLSSPNGKKEDLGYEAEDIISDGMSYQMKVSKAYLVNDEFVRTYEDGTVQDYLLPSTAEVHAFYVETVSLWGDSIEIEEAWYQVDGTTERFEALNGQFSTRKYENMMNRSVLEKQSGYIFFVTLDSQETPIEYHGILQLKLKGSEQWIQIQVDLY